MAEQGMGFGFNWLNQSDLTLVYGFSSSAGGWHHQPGPPGAPDRVPLSDSMAFAFWELSETTGPTGPPGTTSSLEVDVTVTIAYDRGTPSPFVGQGWSPVQDQQNQIQYSHHFASGEGGWGHSAALQDQGSHWALPDFNFNSALQPTEEYTYKVSVSLTAQDTDDSGSPVGSPVTWQVDPTLIIGGRE
ncbi:MAG TPA: hypothetical protein VLV83_25050 [Acidobacteriota bacterium]|nr:hypothetical protein [Acidobacteriota bacterium]